MYEIINSIIDAISISLDAEFEDCEIHSEEIKQDLNEPCFFIASLNPTRSRYFGSRFFNSNNFVIQYFPSTNKKQQECNNVAERMSDCLEYITCIGDEKPIQAKGMKFEVVGGVLNFFVSYDLFVVKQEENVAMETMNIDTNVKEGD